jgi:hypothetical protein
MYKQFLSIDGTEIVGVVKDDILSIPFDPANTDYQEYLKWLSEGNQPLPADEPQEP